MRFLTPFVPVLGIAMAIFIVEILPKRFKMILPVACLFLLFPIYSMLYSSFRSAPGRDINFGPFIVTQKYGHTVFPPPNEIWPIPEIIDFIYKDSVWQENNIFIAITPSLPEFNHNNFRYIAAWKNYKNLDFGGPPRESLISAITRLGDAEYIITRIEGESGPEFINKFNSEIQQMLDEEKLPYQKIKEFSLPDNTKVTIYKKYERNQQQTNICSYSNF